MRLPVVVVTLFLSFASACSCGDRGTQLGPKLLLEGAEPDESGAADWKVDFGTVLVHGKSTPALHFRNAGSAPLKVRLEAPVPSPFGSAIGAAGLTIDVGGKAAATFFLQARKAGTFDEVVEIRSNEAGKERRKLRLVGSARTPDLRCSPEALDFGMVLLGQEKRLHLRCKNELDVPLSVGPATFSGAAQFFEAVAEGEDSALVQPGAELELVVTYRAQIVGSFSAQLHLAEESEVALAAVPLLAEAVTGDLQILPRACLDFGTVEVGGAARRTLRILNVSGDERIVHAIETRDDVSLFSATTPALPFAVPPAGEVEVTVEYRPLARGMHQDLLSFVFGASGEGQRASACVQGGSNQARLACSPRLLDFGDVAVGTRSTLAGFCEVGASDGSLEPLFLADLEVAGGFEARILHRDGSEGPKAEGYAPGETFFLEASFRPDTEGLAEGQIVLYAEGTPAPIDIDLLGAGRELPACVFEVRPPSLRFGYAPVGERRTLEFSVRNDFDDACLLNGLRLERGSDPAFTVEEVASVEIPPRERRTFPVHFAPEAEGRATGAAVFTISDPAAPLQRVELSGRGGASCLQIEPAEVDFGGVPPGCNTRHLEVSVANLCNQPVAVDSIEIDRIASPSFRITQAPIAPVALAPGQRIEVLVAYVPEAEGIHRGALVFEIPDDEPLVVPLRGEGSQGVERIDTFTQLGNGKVDVLWVIDNSGSMSHRQAAIRDRVEPFMAFALEQRIDFQVGVTTTGLEPFPSSYQSCPGGVDGGEAGRLFPVDNSSPRILTKRMSFTSLADAWRKNLDVGTCHAYEYPFEAARRALSPPLINSAKVPGTPELNDGNLGFLRPDAALSIIIVHDQANELETGTPVEDFVASFKALKPARKQDLVKVHMISGKATGSACALNCPRCVAAAELSGGLWLDICNPNAEDWTETMRKMSEAAFGVEARIDLSAQPADLNGDWRIDDKDVELRIDGKVRGSRVPSGGRVWWYDTTSNGIVFEPTYTPKEGQVITVKFTIACG